MTCLEDLGPPCNVFIHNLQNNLHGKARVKQLAVIGSAFTRASCAVVCACRNRAWHYEPFYECLHRTCSTKARTRAKAARPIAATPTAKACCAKLVAVSGSSCPNITCKICMRSAPLS